MIIGFIVTYLIVGFFVSAYAGYIDLTDSGYRQPRATDLFRYADTWNNVGVALAYFIIIPIVWPAVVLYFFLIHMVWEGLFKLFNKILRKGGKNDD